MGKAWIDGAPAPFAEAVSAAARRLASSRLPLVTGLATDVAGLRAAVRLAEVSGGVIDHARSEPLYRNLDVLRRAGLFRGVPAELKRRADRVLLVGGDAMETAPDLLAYLLSGDPDLGRAAGEARRTVWLGGAGGSGPAGVPVETLPISAEETTGFVGMMRASLAGRRIDATDAKAERAAELAGWLAEAKFAAVVWSARALDGIAIESLTGLVSELNATTRASAVPLGEAGEAWGAAETATWLSGYPLRVSFARGAAEHDPVLFHGARLMASGECDLLVHVDARAGLSLGQLSPSIPTIAISAEPSAGAGVSFEVAPAGEGEGALWDERLASFARVSPAGEPSGRPSAVEVLTALCEALAPLLVEGRAA